MDCREINNCITKWIPRIDYNNHNNNNLLRIWHKLKEHMNMIKCALQRNVYNFKLFTILNQLKSNQIKRWFLMKRKTRVPGEKPHREE